MANFYQRWTLLGGLGFVTLLLMVVQEDHRCPDFFQMWAAEKQAGRDPLPSLIKEAGLEIKDPSMQEAKPIEAPEKPETPLEIKPKKRRDVYNQPGLVKPLDRDILPLPVDTLKYESLLNSNFIPNTVFYIWCGRRWLEFNHYLSIKSVIQQLKPDNLIFYYEEEPVMDYWVYNTWYKELQDEYPFFRRRKLGDKEVWGKACSGIGKPNADFIYNRLEARGGMYINEHTILDNFAMNIRENSLVHAFNETTLRGFVMAKAGVKVKEVVKDPTRKDVKFLQCARSNQTYDTAPKKPICVNAEDRFFPENIWELDSDFGRLVRRIFYQTPKILKPEPSFDELIPNIAHIVWIGGGEMDFLFYLGVLSLIYVAKVENVYIHGNAPPKGPYWDRIKNHKKIHLIFRETPKTVYQTEVNVLSHITDVWRVDFMIRYGGIYVDTDTVFVKPLDRQIRGYDAVGSVDWTYWNPPYPDTINFGVAVGKRNALYWHKFQETMKWWIDKDWSFNGLRQPYRMKERFPELVKIDPHLQVICYEFKCHPTWWPNYHNESIHHLNSPSITDWHEEVYAFHWTLPTPPELKSEENALKGNSMFNEIAKFVLHQAGILKQDFELKYTKFKLPPPPVI